MTEKNYVAVIPELIDSDLASAKVCADLLLYSVGKEVVTLENFPAFWHKITEGKKDLRITAVWKTLLDMQASLTADSPQYDVLNTTLEIVEQEINSSVQRVFHSSRE
jgi:hypothetical protein